ncbi:LMBR1 domain-containing protein [Histoplasma capsulatum H143]|uniref:LMBR1 domain-containing protein n=1 Tax=Ajellomyces capsulatus (strain H143) TaxID=544712 RepID=C6H1L5_AJECH|nr:LMBR1 domain-containing protein [Histoplasma capsulatum H143]
MGEERGNERDPDRLNKSQGCCYPAQQRCWLMIWATSSTRTRRDRKVVWARGRTRRTTRAQQSLRGIGVDRRLLRNLIDEDELGKFIEGYRLMTEPRYLRHSMHPISYHIGGTNQQPTSLLQLNSCLHLNSIGSSKYLIHFSRERTRRQGLDLALLHRKPSVCPTLLAMSPSVATSSSAPVGSGIFVCLALLVISILVLLLLRLYLPLRSTPAFLSFPVFLALALPASVVLLVPIDLTSSTRGDEPSSGIWLPPRVMLVSWRIAYWLTFVMTWVILPLLGEYVDSGYRTPKDRILYSLRSNGRYQLIVLGSGIAGLVYISIQNGFDFTSIKALVMALAYFWGLALAIYLMGHGLVVIPRTLIRNANPGNKLRRIQARAPRIHDRLTDSMADLEDLEFQVSQLRKNKTGAPYNLQEWIDELVDMTSIPESRLRASAGANESRSSVPPTITARYLADITRRLARARHQNARFANAWEKLVREAADTQAIIDSSASKRLEFSHLSFQSSSNRSIPYITPTLRYYIYVHILPAARLILAGFFSLASACVVWSEIIKSFAPRASIVTLSVVHNPTQSEPIGFLGQVASAAWIFYMCSAAFVGVTDVKVWGNRALVPRNTYSESACWYAGQIAKLTVPLSYNFLTFLPQDVQKKTTFYNFLGRLINLTPLGKGFDYIFPIFILIPVCATLFNLYGRVKSWFDFGLLEDDEDVALNSSGFGTGGWREGRELIESELTGSGALGLSSQRAAPVHRRTASTPSSGPTIWVPPADLPRNQPQGPTARATVSTRIQAVAAAPEEDEEENFFQSFAHRVRNTFETASTPQWLRADNVGIQRPRWLGGQGSDVGDGTTNLGRWFGGRPAEGQVQI